MCALPLSVGQVCGLDPIGPERWVHLVDEYRYQYPAIEALTRLHPYRLALDRMYRPDRHDGRCTVEGLLDRITELCCPVHASSFQPAIPVLSPAPPPSTATPGHGAMPRPANRPTPDPVEEAAVANASDGQLACRILISLVLLDTTTLGPHGGSWRACSYDEGEGGAGRNRRPPPSSAVVS